MEETTTPVVETPMETPVDPNTPSNQNELEALWDATGIDNEMDWLLKPGSSTSVTMEDPKVGETKVEDKTVEAPKEEVPQTKTLGDADSAAALQLWQALKDPELAPTILEFLGRQNKPKEPEKDITTLLKESLPDDYAHLAEILAPALAKTVDVLVDGKTKGLQESAEQIARRDNEAIVRNVYDSFAKDVLGLEAIPEVLDQEIAKSINDFPYTGKGSFEDYTRSLLYLAKGKLDLHNKAVNTPSSQQKGPNSAAQNSSKVISQAARISRTPAQGLDNSTPQNNRATKMTLEEAMNAAHISFLQGS